ncbi:MULTISPECIES: HAD family phosphatase [unclassified Photobacterium]|uniref:HAD family hydrolase n=1 Tax=unclassified Photobacterium TaxID=2628852 RepID=UPI000D1611CC|nr:MULTISPECIES: HAD family phosphatase [unclassified Photobacterium]PSV27109.1 HAD family phosphatase [Photobacterium sp. GB-56]PSV29669.1 HAD family phosphatase [Photobacterium sp. GB-72]PSV52093.1 HAD family phosphatase [Photobacterium sp. GB-1]PSW73431.1 HAD family phosphatase [Photobacterium sp. GB-50]
MIRNVIFDFGAVLFEWDPQKIVDTFTQSIDEQNILMKQVLAHPDWLALDRGTMLLAEEIPKFSARTGISCQRMEDFINHIQLSLEKIPETEALFFRILDKNYPTYYLTNMCSAFFETLYEKHHFISFFDGGVVSGKELTMKPEPEIFHLLCQRYHLNPHECLFIDDHYPNIETAKSLGFNTVHFTPTQDCIREIEEVLAMFSPEIQAF